MSTETFYFSHDYNARNDPKLQKLLMKQGQEGKGIFWDLIEMLYEQSGYLILKDCETYAFQLRTNYERITDVIQNYELFSYDDTKFWSESVLRRLDERKMKSEKARNSIKKRWENTNVLQTNYDSNTNKGKERKGKEKKIKENKVKIFIPPTLEEIIAYFLENGYSEECAKKAYNYYAIADWHDSKGDKIRNWKQKMQAVWFKPENLIKPEKSRVDGYR
jgi:hypothetical protein